MNAGAEVMRAAGVRARTTRRFVRTTDSKHRLPVSDNLLDREFTASKPNQKWAMDATYVATLEGWLFLTSWWTCSRGGSSGGRWTRP